MVNTFLEEIKNLGYDQEKVLEILKKSKELENTGSEEPEPQPEPEPEPQPDNTEDNKDKDKKLDIDITKLTEDITKSVSGTVKKVVSKEIKEQIKKLRKAPPVGTESEDFIGNNPFVKKNLFERRV